MVRGKAQLVWVLAACAAVGAQITPKVLCQACDQPCCAGLVDRLAPTTTEAGVEPAGPCPLCASEAGQRPATTTERPCSCQLKARHDQPLSSARGVRPAGITGDPAIGTADVASVVPLVLGVSREYVAASLAVPIRPLRILLGVWRN